MVFGGRCGTGLRWGSTREAPAHESQTEAFRLNGQEDLGLEHPFWFGEDRMPRAPGTKLAQRLREIRSGSDLILGLYGQTSRRRELTLT